MTDNKPSPTTDQGTGLVNVATDEDLYFVTSNDAKYRTGVNVFGPEITLERTHVDVDEIQSTDPDVVVERKANAAFERVGDPVLVDDFSLFMDGLNRFPGPLIKHLLMETGLRGLEGLASVADEGCTMRCTAAIHDGETVLVTHGELRGTLRLPTDPSDGSADMPVSTVFVPDGYERPVADLDVPTHRYRAYSKLRDMLIE